MICYNQISAGGENGDIRRGFQKGAGGAHQTLPDRSRHHTAGGTAGSVFGPSISNAALAVPTLRARSQPDTFPQSDIARADDTGCSRQRADGHADGDRRAVPHCHARTAL